MKILNFRSFLFGIFNGRNFYLIRFFLILLMYSCSFVEVVNEPNFSSAQNSTPPVNLEGIIKGNIESEYFPKMIKQNSEIKRIFEYKVYEDSFPQEGFFSLLGWINPLILLGYPLDKWHLRYRGELKFDGKLIVAGVIGSEIENLYNIPDLLELRKRSLIALRDNIDRALKSRYYQNLDERQEKNKQSPSIYIYKPSNYGKRMKVLVKVDNRDFELLKDRPYMKIDLPEGSHTITTCKGISLGCNLFNPESNVSLFVEPGKDYYFRAEYQVGAIRGRILLRQVPEYIGKIEIEQ